MNMENGNKGYSEICADWQTLRSKLYLYHHGICWICHEHIELQDCEIGHLVDQCNGGKDTIENIAPMHKRCNNTKPRHNTMEEHITWLLKSRWLAQKANPKNLKRTSLDNIKKSIPQEPIGINSTIKPNPSKYTEALPQTTPKAFANDNEVKLEALRLIGKIIDNPMIEPSKGLFPSRPLVARPTNTPICHYQRTKQIFQLKPPTPLTQGQLDKIKPMTICWIQGRPMGVPMWKVLPPPYRQEDRFSVRVTPPGAFDNGSGGIRETLQIIGGTVSQDIDITFNIGMQTYHITSTNGKLSITFKGGNESNSGDRRQTVGMGIGQIPIALWKQAKSQGISFKAFVASYNQTTDPSKHI